jgi:hypothetical protein
MRHQRPPGPPPLSSLARPPKTHLLERDEAPAHSVARLVDDAVRPLAQLLQLLVPAACGCAWKWGAGAREMRATPSRQIRARNQPPFPSRNAPLEGRAALCGRVRAGDVAVGHARDVRNVHGARRPLGLRADLRRHLTREKKLRNPIATNAALGPLHAGPRALAPSTPRSRTEGPRVHVNPRAATTREAVGREGGRKCAAIYSKRKNFPLSFRSRLCAATLGSTRRFFPVRALSVLPPCVRAARASRRARPGVIFPLAMPRR